MDDHDNKSPSSTIVLAGTRDVLTGEHAVYLALRTGKDPLAAYFQAEFLARLQEHAAPGDKDKTRVAITSLRDGSFRAIVEYVPSPGAASRKASKDFGTLRDLVRTLNHALLKGSGKQEAGLLSHLAESRNVDYEAGLAHVKQMLRANPQAMASARNTLRAQINDVIEVISPGSDYSLIVRLDFADEVDEHSLASVVAQIDFYRLPPACAQTIERALAPIAQQVRKGENSQKYTTVAPSTEALLNKVGQRLGVISSQERPGRDSGRNR